MVSGQHLGQCASAVAYRSLSHSPPRSLPHVVRAIARPLLVFSVVPASIALASLAPLACSDGPHGWEGGGEPVADASTTNDAGYGAGSDGAPNLDAATAPVNGCTAADFAAEDHTADADPRLVLVPT